MADDIRRWSDELARDPASLVFLQLGDALRRQGQLDLAFKIASRGLERHQRNADAHDLVARIAVDRRDFPRAVQEWEQVLRLAPSHLGAMKGLGYVCFQQGMFEDAKRYLAMAAAGGGGHEIANAMNAVRRSSGEVSSSIAAAVPEDAPVDPVAVFAGLLLDDDQSAMLLDDSGLVMAGSYADAEGHDLAQDVGAQLSGISDEVVRSTRHLGIGDWCSITFETQTAVVAMAPSAGGSLMVVVASRATPLGLLRRLLERCGSRAGEWLNGGRP